MFIEIYHLLLRYINGKLGQKIWLEASAICGDIQIIKMNMALLLETIMCDKKN